MTRKTAVTASEPSDENGRSVYVPTPSPPSYQNSDADYSVLKRKKSKAESDKEATKEPIPVAAGPVGQALDLAYNSSREKTPEFTVIDRIQAKLLPQLDVIDLCWQELIEVSAYRYDSDEYKRIFKQNRPMSPNLIEEFKYSTAQWQKSVNGMNLKSLVEVVRTQIESQSAAQEEPITGGGFEG